MDERCRSSGSHLQNAQEVSRWRHNLYDMRAHQLGNATAPFLHSCFSIAADRLHLSLPRPLFITMDNNDINIQYKEPADPDDLPSGNSSIIVVESNPQIEALSNKVNFILDYLVNSKNRVRCIELTWFYFHEIRQQPACPS